MRLLRSRRFCSYVAMLDRTMSSWMVATTSVRLSSGARDSILNSFKGEKLFFQTNTATKAYRNATTRRRNGHVFHSRHSGGTPQMSGERKYSDLIIYQCDAHARHVLSALGSGRRFFVLVVEEICVTHHVWIAPFVDN